MTASSVSCILYSKDHKAVCLIKRRDVPVWVLPGGGIDPGESAETAAEREAYEELGVKCHIKRLIGIYYPKNRLSKKTFLYELITDEMIEDQPSSETLGAQFFMLDKLPKMPPPYKQWVLDSQTVPSGAVLYSYVPGVHWGNFIKLLLLHPVKVLRFILSRLGLHWNS